MDNSGDKKKKIRKKKVILKTSRVALFSGLMLKTIIMYLTKVCKVRRDLGGCVSCVHDTV